MAKKKEEENLNLNDAQQRVAEALVFSGVSYERERLVKILEPHRGKAIDVSIMIDVINNVPPKPEETEEQE